MRNPWRFLAAALGVVMVAACTGPQSPPAQSADEGAGPAAAITAFTAAWHGGRTHDASRFTDDPAAAALLMSTVMTDLHATNLAIATGPIDRTGADHAAVTATLTWTLPEVGDWSYDTRWQWTRSGPVSDPSWQLDFSPTVIHPELGPQQSIVVRTIPASDGPIVDRNDAQLLTDVRVYSVVVILADVADVRALADTLADLLHGFDTTITAASITAGITAARRSGHDSYTVVNLRESDYQSVEAALLAIPALSLPSKVRSLPPSPGFADTVLDSAIPVAEKMTVGTPGWKIVTVDSSGDDLATLAEHAAIPGAKVTLTLDPAVQQAAQQAIDPIAEPAVVVAIQPSTGEILAVAQNAAADSQGPIALTGRYPPGSTFKIVTATAAIEDELVTPTTSVACPGEWTTHHRTIHNEGFALGTVTVTTAFARSCNTTFAKLASELPPEALPEAAAQYGIGLDFTVQGITTLTGEIQPGETVLQRAENGFGQGTDLVTPFSAALMAATAATGNMPTPVLIRGTSTEVDTPAPPRPESVRTGIRTLMRAVVTRGTARSLAGDGTVYAKTGTAEYLTGDGDIQAHAWTVGFRGDVAFSILIVGGNSSRRTNDIAHTFLRSLPAP